MFFFIALKIYKEKSIVLKQTSELWEQEVSVLYSKNMINYILPLIEVMPGRHIQRPANLKLASIFIFEWRLNIQIWPLDLSKNKINILNDILPMLLGLLLHGTFRFLKLAKARNNSFFYLSCRHVISGEFFKEYFFVIFQEIYSIMQREFFLLCFLFIQTEN